MKKKRRWSSTQIMVLGFLVLILMGALVLMLPVCNADGRWLDFTDALFTACTCVCVTGLVTVVPAVQFTLLGKLVMLVLIQIGGWGVIVCAMYLLVLFKVKLTVRERVILRSYFNMSSMRGLVGMLQYVIRASLVVEGIGAMGYCLCFIPRYGLARGVWYSVFHAVSAFCNAGVDLLGDSSLAVFVTDPMMNLVTVFLIISGGLGFMVWQDLTRFVKKLTGKTATFSRAWQQLSLHTKLVMVMTGILLMGGTVFFLAVEYDNPRTLGNLSFGGKLMAAFFQSVTTRTAGFFTVPQDGLREISRLVSCMLMYVGGSPVGTAGGVKTVTAAVIFLSCGSILAGHSDTECFGRRIPMDIVKTSLSVCMVSLVLAAGGIISLALAQPQASVMDITYEVISATATVGLTAGLTPQLGLSGKLIVIVLMYMGRIGPVTVPLLIAGSLDRRSDKRKLPGEHIMVG